MKTVKIRTPYITLGQLIKYIGLVNEGGEAKIFLATHGILVNGEKENRRGRKLRQGDVIEMRDGSFVIEASDVSD